MKPLNSFNQLIKWKISDINDKCLIDYKSQSFQEDNGKYICERFDSKRNKVLFCHDMKGGYLDDALTEKNENIFAYRFYYWNLIDIFVYFSHHFVTIPPQGWIYQCHKNGVQCLGTFIFEDQNQFNVIMASDDLNKAAEKLTEIKNFYNFEGWLINIECRVEKRKYCKDVISKILSFLNRLKELGNEVYWYDAITKSGRLDWQNCLTVENKPFYDCCGNIFTNYSWNESKLAQSIKMSDGDLCKTFVGIDCFGRGCPGGGKLNCNIALKLIEKAFKDHESTCNSKFSIALFAPGWCYESLSSHELMEKLDKHTWLFYNLMAQYLHPWLDGQTIFRQLPEVNLDKDHNFQTNFGIGQGTSYFVKGVEMVTGNYNWLMDQNLIPTGTVSKAETSEMEIKMFPVRTVGYQGYGCMKMFTKWKDKRKENIIVSSPVTMELFRMGCSAQGNDRISLKLVLGHDVIDQVLELWNGICLVINFNKKKESEIRTVRFMLNEIKINQFVSPLKIEWHTFKIHSLATALAIAPGDGFTIRKLSLKFVIPTVLEFMMSSSIYLGFLELKTGKNK